MSSLLPLVKNIGWLQSAQKGAAAKKGRVVKITVVGRGEKAPSQLLKSAPTSVKEKIKQDASVVQWEAKAATQWLVQLDFVEPGNHYGHFTPSPYSMARDLMGACFRQIIAEDVKSIQLEHIGNSDEELQGLLVGMEMAQYKFKNVWPEAEPLKCKIKIKSKVKDIGKSATAAATLGESINLARLLVDLPGNLLQPQDYADLLQAVFGKKAKTKVDIWNMARLQKEKMGLHIAVGQAALQGPHMVKVQYRGGGKEKPIAFVGKGITFDAGGLDIKPASGMRLMKKDMGGSASVAGIAYWVVNSKLKLNCDFYFAIAENSVGTRSFRPGDVLTARNGKTVEIHNTDAEGRLVLADCMTVAAESKPRFLIDVATLTGAIKVGLSSGMPGLFSNHDNLAENLVQAGRKMGDLSWRMPLIPEEKARLKSDVADVVNCTSGFGGAVTAALFLEMFTDNVPWAHFDIYGWVDSARGAYSSSGGSGQIVQCVSQFLQQESENL